jgi:hypothetical protein
MADAPDEQFEEAIDEARGEGSQSRRSFGEADWAGGVRVAPSHELRREAPMTEDPIPGEWRPDPTGRHEYRFWSPTDGWTAHVADHGVNARDDRGRRLATARDRIASKGKRNAEKRAEVQARLDESKSRPKRSLRDAWSDVQELRNSTFGSIALANDRIVSKQGSGTVAGATATVGTKGDIERRITATRLLLTGPFALAFRKKRDHRELHLLIEGRGFAIIEPVRKSAERQARRFAANVNAAAKQAEVAERPAAVEPASTQAPSVLDRLEQLGRLRHDGVLTDDEFDAQKRRILEDG